MTVSRRCLLLSLPLVLLVAVGLVVRTAQRRTSAISAIERLGGRIVTTRSGPAWLRRIPVRTLDRLFERATLVNLAGTQADDADLALLGRLDGLERLNLSRTRITDDGLSHLAGLTRLKALDLTGTAVTGTGLAQLRSLDKLEYLYLARTRVTDDGLRRLGSLKRLRRLDLTGTAVTVRGVEELARALPETAIAWSGSSASGNTSGGRPQRR